MLDGWEVCCSYAIIPSLPPSLPQSELSDIFCSKWLSLTQAVDCNILVLGEGQASNLEAHSYPSTMKKSKPVHTQSIHVSAYKLWWHSLAPPMIIYSDEIDPIWVLMMAHHALVIAPVISSLHTHCKAKTDWNRLRIALMAASVKVCNERDWREFKLLWKNVRGKVFVICSWLVSAARVTTKERVSCCWWTNSPAL